jgi:hypothetical protein
MKITILTIVLVLLSAVPLITGTGPINYANAEYAGTQNPATANDCDKGALCAGSSSLFSG